MHSENIEFPGSGLLRIILRGKMRAQIKIGDSMFEGKVDEDDLNWPYGFRVNTFGGYTPEEILQKDHKTTYNGMVVDETENLVAAIYCSPISFPGKKEEAVVSSQGCIALSGARFVFSKLKPSEPDLLGMVTEYSDDGLTVRISDHIRIPDMKYGPHFPSSIKKSVRIGSLVRLKSVPAESDKMSMVISPPFEPGDETCMDVLPTAEYYRLATQAFLPVHNYHTIADKRLEGWFPLSEYKTVVEKCWLRARDDPNALAILFRYFLQYNYYTMMGNLDVPSRTLYQYRDDPRTGAQIVKEQFAANLGEYEGKTHIIMGLDLGDELFRLSTIPRGDPVTRDIPPELQEIFDKMYNLYRSDCGAGAQLGGERRGFIDFDIFHRTLPELRRVVYPSSLYEYIDLHRQFEPEHYNSVKKAANKMIYAAPSPETRREVHGNIIGGVRDDYVLAIRFFETATNLAIEWANALCTNYGMNIRHSIATQPGLH